jgi:signal transduction histidine kinase/ActR/RegA family two-component response regulator
MQERLAAILGPSSTWPRALDAALGVCMTARVPMMLWWRASGALFYNDAAIAFVGVRRPFGEPLDHFGDDSFAALLRDLTERVAASGTAVTVDEHALLLGTATPTETILDVAASPVHEAGAVAAVLITLADATARVVAARRTRLLQALAQRASTPQSAAASPARAATTTLDVLRADTTDIAACAIYVVDEAGEAVLAGSFGLDRFPALTPSTISLAAAARFPSPPSTPMPASTSPPAPASSSPTPQSTTSPSSPPVPTRDSADAPPRDSARSTTSTPASMSSAFATAPWPFAEAASRKDGVRVPSVAGPAVVLPLPRPDGERPLGFFVAILHEHVAFDDRCAMFLRMIALELASGVASARVKEDRDRLQEFLAMLAHELRNPLAPIRTALTLLDARISKDERARHYLDTLERQSANLARLVDDLLDVSRITRGLIALQTENVDLGGVVDRALETLRPTLEAKSIDVAVTKPMRPVRMIGDPVRLEQIVLNLIGNAAKYTNRGGHVHVALEQGGNVAELHVRDDGVGIPPDMLPRVFDLFQQAQRTLDRSQGGLGIGLTIVKSLVALHRGTVEATSAGVGLGSEFVVRLPAVDLERTTTPAPTPAHAKPAAGARRVLVVDDNIDAADTLADLASEWGHTVKSAHTGPDALKAAQEMIPDVVLLDIGLPEMDGYEVARRMRANPALDDAFLVALTGYGQQRDRERAAEAGFDHHLVKPVNIDRLEDLLRSARRRPERPMGEQVH